MSKTKSTFFCQNCGQESAKWVGKCPGCNEWNTFVEEVIVKGTDKAAKEDWRDFSGMKGLKTISINDVVSSFFVGVVANAPPSVLVFPPSP